MRVPHPCRRLFAALTLTAAAAAAAPAGPAVAPADRVPNKAPGYCAWSAIATLARANARHYPRDPAFGKLCDLVEIRGKARGETVLIVRPGLPPERVELDPGGSYPSVVRKQLAELGVSFEERPADPRVKDFAFLKKACDDGWGAMVEVRDCPPVCFGSHALAVTDVSAAPEEFARPDGTAFRDTAVYYVDSNDTSVTYRACKEWFDRAWSGWAVVVRPRGGRVVWGAQWPRPPAE